MLVRILLETKQPVPDFLEQWKPEDVNALDFNDDSDEEGEGQDDNNAAGSGGDAWGSTPAPAATSEATPAAKDAWNPEQATAMAW